MNIKQLMKQAQQMQQQMQEKMAAIEVEGTAGGGMVTVTMNGSKEVGSIRIDPEAVDPADVEMLQDLVLAAIHDATRKVEEELQAQLGGMAGGMNLPGMF